MSGETRVEALKLHPHQDAMSKLSLGLNSSGGSTGSGEDSSGEEQPLGSEDRGNDRVVAGIILGKQMPPSRVSLAPGSLLSMICGRSGRRGSEEEEAEVGMEEDVQDDEGSVESYRGKGNRRPIFEGGHETSGENSDAEDTCEERRMGGGGSSKSGEEDGAKSCGRPIQCDVCNMRFSNGANMRRHRMRHSGIKPFECKICQKRFFRKDHLAEHMATHSKLLPFRCPICNKGFQRQIAMRAHFQNEHVGGSQDVVKACPLCAYKAGSMKSLRVHFYSRHGIDLDNPMPSSPLLCPSSGHSSSPTTPNPGAATSGEYSELAHALGFEDRDKSSDIPSHFLVPQIEIYPHHGVGGHYFTNPDSHEKRKGSSLTNHSPHSDSNIPSSSQIKVKKEEEPEEGVQEEVQYPEEDEEEDCDQDMPQDLTLSSGNSYRSPETSPASSHNKLSSLKSLLREDYRPNDAVAVTGVNGGGSGGGGSLILPRDRSDSSSGHSSNSQNQSYDTGDAITSSNGVVESGGNALAYGRRGMQLPSLFCVYCGIIFPDKTLYFLHKGCHSDHNPWRCNICGELCNDVYDFNSHLLSKSHQ